MYEEAIDILNYLPIGRDKLENNYINHLWQTFLALDNADPKISPLAPPFAMMPFHLLFMFSVQYKVLRIYKVQKEKYTLALITKNYQDQQKQVLCPSSPSTIAYLNESEIINLLRIVGLSSGDTTGIKKLTVDYRNNEIAHAKGVIESNMESKFKDYFNSLEKIQDAYKEMNEDLAEAWIAEIQADDDMDQFFAVRFLGSCFTPYDFVDVIGKFLRAEKLSFDQRKQIVKKGLDLISYKTIEALLRFVKEEKDLQKKSYALKILEENGEI